MALLLGLAGCKPGAEPVRPEITVRVSAPGLSVEAIERDVILPLETKARLPKVKSVRSVATRERAAVTAVFDRSEDLFVARREMTARLAGLSLPGGVYAELDPAPGVEQLRFVLASETETGVSLREIAGEIRRGILHVPGVSAVALCGGAIEEIDLALDPARLSARNLGVSDVTDALSREASAGSKMILSTTSFRGLEEVGAVVVSTEPAPILVRDLASIARAPRSTGCDAMGKSGPVVTGTIRVNESIALARVKEKISERRAKLPAGVQLDLLEGEDLISFRLESSDEIPDARAVARAAGETAGVLDVVVEEGDGEWSSRRIPGDMDLRVRSASGQLAATTDAVRAKLRSMKGVKSIRASSDSARVIFLPVTGDDLATLKKASATLRDAFAKVPGVSSAGVRGDRGAAELDVELDRVALARLGVAAGAVAQSIEAALHGSMEGRVVVDGRILDIRARIATSSAGTEGLANLMIPTASGTRAPLSQIAKIRQREQPLMILREDGARSVTIWIEIDRGQETSIRKALREAAAAQTLPADVRLVWR